MTRINILKTYKIFVAGIFTRSESGRYYLLKNKKNKIIANVSLCSKKDFRDAVTSARTAFDRWSLKSPMNRGQILYRMAEMLEGRKSQFIDELISQGITANNAKIEVELSIDRLIYYAGWCDKYQTLFSSVNPVASSHYNFSVQEPTGVVSVIAGERLGLLGIVSVIAPIIAGGNTCVMLASESLPLSSITFAEVLVVSDLPFGVVNILTGKVDELIVHFASHMDVNSIVYCRNNKKELKLIAENCALNVKRFFQWNKDWQKEENQNPYLIIDLQEVKTTWHPIESIGVGGANY